MFLGLQCNNSKELTNIFTAKQLDLLLFNIHKHLCVYKLKHKIQRKYSYELRCYILRVIFYTLIVDNYHFDNI